MNRSFEEYYSLIKKSTELDKKLNFEISSDKKYKDALSLINNSDSLDSCNSAVKLLKELGNYRDSKQLLNNISNIKSDLEKEQKYQNAVNAIEYSKSSSDFSKLKNAFDSLGNYRDSAALSKRCSYEMESCEYTQLLAEYEKIPRFPENHEQIRAFGEKFQTFQVEEAQETGLKIIELADELQKINEKGTKKEKSGCAKAIFKVIVFLFILLILIVLFAMFPETASVVILILAIIVCLFLHYGCDIGCLGSIILSFIFYAVIIGLFGAAANFLGL